jgi:hypothetical protein
VRDRCARLAPANLADWGFNDKITAIDVER